MAGRSPAMAAGALALAAAVIAGYEGLRTTAYRDPVGIPTVCYGETEGVSLGDTATAEECAARLQARVAEFSARVAPCLPPDLPDPTRAAFVSLAYNIGPGAFCRSSVSRKALAGDLPGACAEISRWHRAGGRTLPGLVVRRGEERQMCEEGLKK